MVTLDGPIRVGAGGSVTFVATVNEDETARPLTYQWKFGDKDTGSGLTTTHTYEAPGRYTVQIEATNGVGTDTGTVSVLV